MIEQVVYGADRMAANPAPSPRGTPPPLCPQEGEPDVPKGLALLLLVFFAANACGATPPPAARGDVERGTALPPPGFNASATAVRR
jgi:hypothetical protein